MYTIKQIAKNKIKVYLHEDCEFDIHYIAQHVMNSYDEDNGAEYIVRDKYSAEIAFF
jgi:hypothetical protein